MVTVKARERLSEYYVRIKIALAVLCKMLLELKNLGVVSLQHGVCRLEYEVHAGAPQRRAERCRRPCSLGSPGRCPEGGRCVSVWTHPCVKMRNGAALGVR